MYIEHVTNKYVANNNELVTDSVHDFALNQCGNRLSMDERTKLRAMALVIEACLGPCHVLTDMAFFAVAYLWTWSIGLILAASK